MNRPRFWAAALLALLLVALLGITALAAPNAFNSSWWTVDGGGGTLNGGAYSLSGTIGQAEAGSLSGGGYSLTGGFWSEVVAAAPRPIYLPLVIR